VSSGYLKASHRELDAAQWKPWRPHHPHTRSVLVPPGEVIEYAIRIYSFSTLFKAGHRIQLELLCNEPFADAFDNCCRPTATTCRAGARPRIRSSAMRGTHRICCCRPFRRNRHATERAPQRQRDPAGVLLVPAGATR
jgi:predicted acyl esterase